MFVIQRTYTYGKENKPRKYKILDYGVWNHKGLPMMYIKSHRLVQHTGTVYSISPALW